MMDKFILWGVGKNSVWQLGRYHIPRKEIELIVDSDSSKWGKDFFGITIEPPRQIVERKWESDIVVIGTTDYFHEIKKQLHGLGWNKRVVSLEQYLANYSLCGDTTAEYDVAQKSDEIVKRIHEAGPISQDLLSDARVLANRNEAIKKLPKGGIIAEIGVAYGDFSEYLLKELVPEHFYAIDYFNKDNPYIQMWGRQELVKSGMTHEEYYKNKFHSQIEANKMTVCSGLSWDCLAEFDNDFFDFIYVDACHDYKSILKDTEIAIKKLKHEGIIQFNDYVIWDVLGKEYYGVVPVVNKMINETHSKVLYYCLSSLGYSDVVVQLNKK